MRTKVDWRSSSKENYDLFRKKHPNVKLSYPEWKSIIYSINGGFRDYLIESGEKEKLPFIGQFGINKKKRKKLKQHEGKQYINLPIDWVKTREKGKRIYNFNHHTEGYFFGFKWFKDLASIKFSYLWFFKPCRIASRSLGRKILTDPEAQHMYKEWG